MKTAITVEEARAIILANVWQAPGEECPLEESVGRVLAEDVHARHDHPLFDMSAVDGYAIGDPQGPWQLVGRLPAGDVHGRALGRGECVRIFTGAQVPEGSHAVVMQERCRMEGRELHVDGNVPAAGANIRRKGEGVRAGDLLLRRGTRIDPAAVGLLASDGLRTVPLTLRPTMGIVCTGSEFLPSDEVLPGRIYSSNDTLLVAAGSAAGVEAGDHVYRSIDTIADIRNAILQATLDRQVVITTGGVSVGEHDLILPALEQLGAEVLFHGVLQKPGKPMLFAMAGEVPIFCLPGNPRAVLVAWYEYVLPFLRLVEGDREPGPRRSHLPMANGLSLKGNRAEFRAAKVHDGVVHLLADEGSHLLGSLVGADGLAYFPQTIRTVAPGDTVELHYLPGR